MNDLEDFFYNRPHNICQKWSHYFRVYERFFSPLRGKPDLRMLEIGVSQGGSLDMWRNYFGQDALIVGVDVVQQCKIFEQGNTKVRIGSQEDRAFLKSIIEEFGEFDIVLDDGGHTMSQQVVSFEELYNSVRPGGVYLVEDCHTNYHQQSGGGIRKHNTFIEHAKIKIDELNGRHMQGYHKEFNTSFTISTVSICFFESMVVFEKGLVDPKPVQAGG